MSNTLGVYDPTFYANEALIWLKNALGMAMRVHRGYDKQPQQKGSVIQIRRPGTFTAQDAPGSDMDVTAENVAITLNKWKEVKFKLTDKELSYTQDQIINEHIGPAAYAIAAAIDEDLCALYKDVPWFSGTAGTTPSTVADITGIRKVLSKNRVPMNDLHLMIDPDAEDKFLQLAAFSQHQGGGDAGVATQMTGSLGTKFMFEVFMNQNAKTHTKGTASTGTLAVNGATTKGATTINLDAGSVTGTLVPGDSFVIAGNTQRYAVTNTVTASGNALTGVTFTPALVADAADDAVVTATLQNGVRNLAFHRHAFALAMAPLSELGNGRGAEIATVIDETTNLTLRSRIWYDGDNSCLKVGLDALYGVKCLNPNLAACLLG